jgi:hypothetical protein
VVEHGDRRVEHHREGGTLIFPDDFVAGNFAGSQPLIEVDGGTLILGAPDGTHANILAAYGSAPFVHVQGTGMVIVEPGNTFDQITDAFAAQAAGATVTQLVTSAPAALPGQAVTFTATVTAAGAPASDGSVEFFDDTTHTFLGTAAVSHGSASLPVTFNAFTAGDTIYATYLPTTGALAPSSGHVTQAVVAATTMKVSGPSTTPTYGQTVTFTATVTDTTPSGGTPTGSVEFYDGSTDLGPGIPLSTSGNSATFTLSTAKLTAGSHTIHAYYTPSGLFVKSDSFLNQTVNQRPITVTAQPNTKTYDGTKSAAATTPTITSGSLAAGDTANFTESYTTANVGTGLTLVPSGTVNDGNGGNNYAVTFVNNTTGAITAKALTMSGLSVPGSKVYDGTATAVVIGTAALQAPEAAGAGSTSDGAPYSADSVSLTGTPTGTYNSKDVATATAVSFGGLSLTGAQAGDYTLTIQGPASATITPKALTMGGLSVPASKVYNGTTTAVVSGSPGSLQASETAGSGTSGDGKPYAGDAVSLAGTATGTYNSKDVATATAVSFGGLSLTGAQAGDYSLTIQGPVAATITPYPFTDQIGNDSHVYGTTANFATDLGTTISTGVNKETLGISYSSTGNTTTALVGSYPITGQLSSNGTGLTSNYNVKLNPGTLSVSAEPGSVFILDPKASGALTVSGSAALKVPGNLIVDSSSSTAVTASGSAAIKAAAIQVTGGYQTTGSATISPTPATKAPAVPDPLGGPAGPSPSGMNSNLAVYLTGTATKTIPPGIYPSIAVSNGAKLTLTSGIYIIEGGGLSVSGSASISGTNVLIVNAGSKYPTIGGTQTYGGITLSNSGAINLSPYTTTGTYAGLVIFQTTDNKQPITLGGSATGAITGTIYAPSAALTVSNGAVVQGGLIVDTLAVSGAAVVVQVATRSAGSGTGTAPGGVQGLSGMAALPAVAPQGPLGLAAAPASGSGAGSRSTAAGQPVGVASVSTAAPTSLAASSRPMAMGLAGGTAGEVVSFLEDPELLADVAISLIAAQAASIRDAKPAPSRVWT